MRKTWHRILFIALQILLIAGIVWGESFPSVNKLIVPGSGITGLKLDQLAPADTADLEKWRENFKKKGIAIDTSYDSNGQLRVSKIHIYSSNYQIPDNWIRVGSSKLQDIIRFYGTGEKKLLSNETLIRYPYSGLEFVIDSKSLVIKKISLQKKERIRFKINSKSIQRFQTIMKKEK